MKVTFTPNAAGTESLFNRFREGLRARGRDIASDAQPPVRTGNLQRSIEVRETADPNVVAVVANTHYAAKIEERKPFLVPALERNMR